MEMYLGYTGYVLMYVSNGLFNIVEIIQVSRIKQEGQDLVILYDRDTEDGELRISLSRDLRIKRENDFISFVSGNTVITLNFL